MQLLILLFFVHYHYGNNTPTNSFGLGYSAFAINSISTRAIGNELFEKAFVRQGYAYTGRFSFLLSRYSSISLGAGINRIQFDKEVQGVFPETNAYGYVIANGTMDYWTFPLALSHYGRLNKGFQFGGRFSWHPAFRGKENFELTSLAGGTGSGYFANYKHEGNEFQHSFRLTGVCRKAFSKSLYLEAEAWVSSGSSYFGNKKPGIVSIGLDLNLLISLPKIYIEVKQNNNKDKETKDKLKEKQKEIEQQLKNQPK